VAARSAASRAAAGTSSAASPGASLQRIDLSQENFMVVLDWLKPAVIFGSIFYAFIGVLILWVCFVLFDKITPYRLWEELTEKKNVALAIVVGAMVIAIGQIVAAAVHG